MLLLFHLKTAGYFLEKEQTEQSSGITKAKLLLLLLVEEFHVVDTNGAGDVHTGTFLAALSFKVIHLQESSRASL